MDLGRGLSTGLLETVIGRSGVGVVVFDQDLRYLFANGVAADINGRSAEDHIGRTLAEVVPDVAPTLGPILLDVLDRNDPVIDAEVTGETPSMPGRQRYWHCSYIPFTAEERPGERLVAVVFVEVTEQRRAQERLAQLIDGLFTFVALLSPEGILLEGNRAGFEAGGVAREDAIGKPFWDTYWWNHSPEVQQQLREAVARAAAGESSRYDVELRVAGDHRITIDFQLAPLFADGEVVALVPSGLDITDRLADRARIEALAHLSRALNGALRTEEVARLTAEHGPAVVEADFANIGLLSRDGTHVQMVLPPVIDVIRERWATIALEGPRTPFHHVFETGEALYVDSSNRAELFPHLVDDARRAGLESVATLPLTDADGSVFGSLALGWARRIEHTDESRARLTVLADLCSQAMQRTRTGEARDDLVYDLQREILAPWEAPRTLEVGVAYRPANDELGFGGDWYDVIILEGRAVFVVGDVAGHGSPAAARMTATKATIRAFVTTFPAEEVIPRVNEALHHLESGYVATAALAWIDKRAHTLTWCLAGHPPAVLRTPEGETRLLEGVHHPPIGMAALARSLPTLPFPPGSQLVLYTDGLIERRDEDLDVRLEALRAEIASLPASMPATAVCDHLIETLSDGHDDVAVIVIRQPEPGS
jgi:PAS domain S-box-containing protein